MTVKIKGNQVAIWGGPGTPPDQPGVWHNIEDFEANVALFVAMTSVDDDTKPKGIDARMVGSIWTRHNAPPKGRAHGDYRDGTAKK
jgi:hypothetical protein